ncbi:hypothetical protein [Chryseobacterium sp. FH2]|uniref:hypothetical protein n=1 Tax=Chryseobacterium sp. FH2 TaxID=1674291 RepID=UPI000AF1E118|nr:hypothetical protein [Chryseobacterium sp. FH2]
MAYTVISVFPATVNTEEIKKDLKEKGFSEANIIVSKSRLENESSVDNYKDDVKTRSFWDHIFANDTEMLDAYSKHSVGNQNVIVYSDNFEEAQRAKAILNERGALEVYKKQTGDEGEKDTAGLPEDVYNGIIAKAKHNIYFLDSERVYHPNSRGMEDTMDDLGSKD